MSSPIPIDFARNSFSGSPTQRASSSLQADFGSALQESFHQSLSFGDDQDLNEHKANGSWPTMLSHPMARFNSDSRIYATTMNGETDLHSPLMNKSLSSPMPPVGHHEQSGPSLSDMAMLGQSPAASDIRSIPRRGQGHSYSQSMPSFPAELFVPYSDMPPHSAVSSSYAPFLTPELNLRDRFAMPVVPQASGVGKAQTITARNRTMRRGSGQTSARTLPTVDAGTVAHHRSPSVSSQTSLRQSMTADHSPRRSSDVGGEMHFPFTSSGMPWPQEFGSGSVTSESLLGSPPMQPIHGVSAQSAIVQPIQVGPVPDSAPASAVFAEQHGSEEENSSDKQPNANEKKRKRREAHNLVERRRRDGINLAIQQLSELLPTMLLEPSGPLAGHNTHHHHKASTGSIDVGHDLIGSPSTPLGSVSTAGTPSTLRPNKSLVLSRTVEYVTHLRQIVEAQAERNRALEQRLSEVYNPRADGPHVTHSESGYGTHRDSDDSLFEGLGIDNGRHSSIDADLP